MSIAPSTTPITMEQLLSSENRGRFELVNGQLEEVPMSTYATIIGVRLATKMCIYCETLSLGVVLDAGGYFRCFGVNGKNARKPDISFVQKARLPRDLESQAFFTIPPDLAVEVISPHDTTYEMNHKIGEYLEGGVRLVWIIDPANRVVMIYRPDGTVQKLGENDTLSGEDVLPGFQCVVKEFLLPK